MENNFEKKYKETKEEFMEKTSNERKKILFEEKEDIFEKKESLTLEDREKIERLEKEMEKNELSSEIQEEVKRNKEQIEKLDLRGKLGKLMNLAKEKGLPFAIRVAKEMNDHYVLDVFHDTLAENGFYKKFEK